MEVVNLVSLDMFIIAGIPEVFPADLVAFFSESYKYCRCLLCQSLQFSPWTSRFNRVFKIVFVMT